MKHCNCIEKFEKGIIEQQPLEGLLVIQATIEHKAVLLNPLSTQIAGKVSLEVDGRRRPVVKNIYFNYCPFCGKPYNRIKKQKVSKLNVILIIAVLFCSSCSYQLGPLTQREQLLKEQKNFSRFKLNPTEIFAYPAGAGLGYGLGLHFKTTKP